MSIQLIAPSLDHIENGGVAIENAARLTSPLKAVFRQWSWQAERSVDLQPLLPSTAPVC